MLAPVVYANEESEKVKDRICADESVRVGDILLYRAAYGRFREYSVKELKGRSWRCFSKQPIQVVARKQNPVDDEGADGAPDLPTPVAIWNSAFRPLGTVKILGAPGELYLVTRTLTTAVDEVGSVWLVVNVAKTERGERSLAAYVKASCDAGSLTIDPLITYPSRFARGTGIRAQSRPTVVARPEDGLSSVLVLMCARKAS